MFSEEFFELEESPVEGQSLQQKDKKRRKRKGKKKLKQLKSLWKHICHKTRCCWKESHAVMLPKPFRVDWN